MLYPKAFPHSQKPVPPCRMGVDSLPLHTHKKTTKAEIKRENGSLFIPLGQCLVNRLDSSRQTSLGKNPCFPIY